ncbi:MAG: thiol:disulfide interchange protein DsbA/DsbL [Gammaproteobacteria bacterium]|jgi:thiol:disulfide interchange protein DsbA|nr:thiol:disulfide interchange protein DsbA/DsbL [Gammaproteobacteria bacterium]MBT3861113.1 thiol:disulfide interchange protein DsbA/DsbL [Gammaproteobacteria bacterium]MBT3987677.1 thiol:disulfide interchange protein DsbA/DsbL [Gammaproteobacteria bacterium]MBT4257389.1 thiol:disulfide interchange protein DsbA/DsbL [Gammaproteobacteria bacterium]MBT4582743.1 thiol:disulfide interchange protein DsbA/DsbL [Gammaproteobacteria bacterium]
MMKRTIQLLTFVVLLPMAFSSFAQIEKYVAGTHYTELRAPVNTNDPSKVEVLEAFWYGCSHCFRFEPLLTDWASRQGDDVDFVHFPAMWNALMKIHGQIYYVAEALDAIDLVHESVFNAINIEGNRLQNEGQIAELFAKHGVDASDFEAAFNSFSVRTKVNQAEKRMQDYQIRSTPNMIVNGKYLVATGEAVRTQAEMLEVVDFLVEKERRMLSSSGE